MVLNRGAKLRYYKNIILFNFGMAFMFILSFIGYKNALIEQENVVGILVTLICEISLFVMINVIFLIIRKYVAFEYLIENDYLKVINHRKTIKEIKICDIKTIFINYETVTLSRNIIEFHSNRQFIKALDYNNSILFKANKNQISFIINIFNKATVFVTRNTDTHYFENKTFTVI